MGNDDDRLTRVALDDPLACLSHPDLTFVEGFTLRWRHGRRCQPIGEFLWPRRSDVGERVSVPHAEGAFREPFIDRDVEPGGLGDERRRLLRALHGGRHDRGRRCTVRQCRRDGPPLLDTQVDQWRIVATGAAEFLL